MIRKTFKELPLNANFVLFNNSLAPIGDIWANKIDDFRFIFIGESGAYVMEPDTPVKAVK
jgi:hypothetical protein